MARRVLPKLVVAVREGAALAKLRKVTERDPEAMRPLLNQLGILLVAQAQKAFRVQQLGNERWPARQSPNVAGIVSDLNAGKSPPGRRFTDRPALIDTGRLRGSLTYRVDGRQVVVGSALPYAALHQSGGKSDVELTPYGKRNLVKLLKRKPDLRQRLGWLFRRPRFTVQVRKRPFLGLTSETKREAEKVIGRFLRERTP